MSEELPDDMKPEYKIAINKMLEKLVALGFATRTMRVDSSGMFHVQFTRQGLMLQEQISKIFAAVNRGDRFDFYELQAFMAIMAMKQFDDDEDRKRLPAFAFKFHAAKLTR
jgi:hypothetical protein